MLSYPNYLEKLVNPLYSENPSMSTFANSEDRDEMQHYQGVHCLKR